MSHTLTLSGSTDARISAEPARSARAHHLRERLRRRALFLRIGAHHDGGFDRIELFTRHADALGVLADRGAVARFIDTERADAPVGLAHDVTPDPAHLVSHLGADLRRHFAGRLQLRKIGPGTGTAYDIEVHFSLLWV